MPCGCLGGQGGACDLRGALPTSIAEPFCSEDLGTPPSSSGYVEVGETADFIPLCDGWMIVADVQRSGISVHHVVGDREAFFFPLPAPPGDLELDEARKILYAALPGQSAVAEVDLLTGATAVVPLAGDPSWLSLGPEGGLLIGVRDGYRSDLYWLATEAAAPVGGWTVDGRLGVYNPVASELVVADLGLSPSSLTRYSFDPATGPVLLQARRNAGSNGQDLAISPDGAHLAFAAGGGNGSGYTVFDFSPTDLSQTEGVWDTGAYPRGVAFDRQSERLLATNGTTLFVFDAEGKNQLDSYSPRSCSYGRLGRIAFSRGGTLGFGRQPCGFDGDSTRLHWFRIDGPPSP